MTSKANTYQMVILRARHAIQLRENLHDEQLPLLPWVSLRSEWEIHSQQSARRTITIVG